MKWKIDSLTGKSNILGRLKKGLSKTRTGFTEKLDSLFSGRNVDAKLLEELEEILVLSDVGVQSASEIIDMVREKVDKKELKSVDALKETLQAEMQNALGVFDGFTINEDELNVFVVLGVNGVGKTTTIGKLAFRFSEEGHKVVVGAGDTFRAAAIEQLEVWSDRVGVDLIKHKSGSDSSAVAYDAVQAALARNAAVLIIDTAGRLHTKKNLMEELKKVRRVTEKTLQAGSRQASMKTLLVLDATIGQNAIKQARAFHDSIGVDGLVVTKLDGTSKGGVVFSIVRELNVPVYFIGVGEDIEDLREFVPQDFVSALFQN